MRRFVAKGIIIGALLVSAVYLIQNAGADCLFVLRNFVEIVAGEVDLPPIKKLLLYVYLLFLFCWEC